MITKLLLALVITTFLILPVVGVSTNTTITAYIIETPHYYYYSSSGGDPYDTEILPHAVKIIIKDTLLNPINNAQINITDSGDFNFTGITNENGSLVVFLDSRIKYNIWAINKMVYLYPEDDEYIIIVDIPTIIPTTNEILKSTNLVVTTTETTIPTTEIQQLVSLSPEQLKEYMEPKPTFNFDMLWLFLLVIVIVIVGVIIYVYYKHTTNI